MEENLLGAEPPTGTLVAATTPAGPPAAAPHTPAEPDDGWEEGTVLPRHRIGRVLGALGTVAGLSAALVPLLRVRELPDDDQSLALISTPLSLGCAAALLALVWLVAQLVRGPLDSTPWAIGCPCNRRPRTKIFARTAPGYEEVERIFRLHFDQGVEGGAQCCAYVRGQKVVELWGVRESSVPEDSYDGRSLQNIFSSTKVVTSLVVAMLVDRGHLRYEQRISELWPEFGQHGKQDITVAELMRHEGGLPKLDRPVPIDATTTAGVRGGRMAAIIAAQIPSWPAHRREYHPISRGWIANEVVIRADPDRRTIGEFVAQEITGPLGLDFYIGLPEEEFDRTVPLSGPAVLDHWAALQSLLPACGRLIEVPSALITLPGYLAFKCYRGVKRARHCGPDPSDMMEPWLGEEGAADVAGHFNHARVRTAELPSANGHANANAMAKIMAVLAAGGSADGVTLLSSDGLARALANPVIAKTMFHYTTAFNNAGWNVFDGYKNSAPGLSFRPVVLRGLCGLRFAYSVPVHLKNNLRPTPRARSL